MLTRYLEEIYFQNLEENLTNSARIIVDFLANSDYFEESQELDAFVNRWSEKLEVRITIINKDGTVIAESYEDKLEMDNHSNRPEIIEAYKNGQGSSIRFSQTLSDRYYYRALPIQLDGQDVGVVRLALPLQSVSTGIAQLHGALLGTTILITIIAVIIAVIIANQVTKPLTNLTKAANEISYGELEKAQETITSISSTTNEIAVLILAFREMTAQLELQIAKLEMEDSKMSAVLGVMTDGILIVDEAGSVQLINPAAEVMFELDHEKIINQSIIKALRHHEIVDLWQKSLATSTQQRAPIELPSKKQYLQCIVTPLGSSLPGSQLLLFQDFSQIRRLETVRQDFISNISHELRTPLASLKALTETLQEGALDDPPAAKHFLNRMETEVDSLSLMVSELIELSRIESGKVPLILKDTAPIDLITQSVERLRLQAERSELNVEIYCDTNLPLVLADENRLEQVLVNLLHNAIKFTTAGGEIIVSAEKRNEYVLFSVQDTGIGIPSNDLERIFERFYKTDRARSSGGTGLGLAISRHIVENHNGQIWAESNEGLGSTFYFSIPTI
jgi:two-component system phosphate regulon sensor histidine kinase PhoR